ncbi:Ras GTPase [Macrophomina phaseolina MS6]|uniref:Ras GTPase n=1 Tax=Macrophomina phaseolina (strain MS6) TaxID=1126212 RepID=K2R9H3_MACPH|nr:Ras GTPase [Macrophomina phaseolina MS6]
MESPRPKHSQQNMKNSKNQPGSTVSSIRSLSSRDGQVSIDSVSSPSSAPQPSQAPLDNGLPANPNRMRDNFKITVMGDTGVGKSELVKKYAYGHTHFRFHPGDRISGSKAVKLSNNDDYMLSVNDTFSVHMDTPIAVHQISQADGVMLVYSPTSRESVETVINVFNFICNHFKDPKGRKTMPVVIVANKVDLELPQAERANLAKGADFARQRGAPYFETSALNEQGIDDAFIGLAERILAAKSEKKEADDVFSKLKRKLQGK